MNKLVKALGLSTILLVTAANDSPGMRVYGGGRAAECYKAVAGMMPSADAYIMCTRALEEGVVSTHDQVATFNNRGVVLMNRDPQRALADFDQAIATNPNRGEPYLNKALVLMQDEGRWRDALPLFDKAIANNSRSIEVAYYGRGFARELSGDLNSAYADYVRAAQLNPRYEAPRRQLSRFTVVR